MPQNGNDFHVITTANVPFFPKQEIHGVIDGPPIEQKDMMVCWIWHVVAVGLGS